jgi:ubiquitin carboxyl-terminal hydrolase 7
MIEIMKNKATFVQSEIQDGDIVCFQTELSEQCVLSLVTIRLA